jgi:hypothetical protein
MHSGGLIMKVLVSTKETQGQRKNDFSWANEGELVTFSMDCDGEKVDGRCGCRRSMSGIVTHKATTTMKVIDVDIRPTQLLPALVEGIREAWGTVMKDKEIIEMARNDLRELLQLADVFTVGKIVERRGNKYQTRI